MPRQSAADAAFGNTASGRIKPPSDLAGPERRLFVELVASCPPDHFREYDLPMLCAYCRACIREQVASAKLSACGYLSEEGKSWASHLRDATRAMTTLNRALKLSPIARTPLPERREVQSGSYYSRMQLEGSRDEPN